MGQRCPVWGQGTFDAWPPGVAIRINGHGLRSAMRSALHKLRGAACGATCTAALPDAAGAAQDRPRARAVCAVRRSDVGLPCSRVQGYQALRGVPVAEATPWDQIAPGGDWRSGVLASRER